jgi:hypothetical protein
MGFVSLMFVESTFALECSDQLLLRGTVLTTSGAEVMGDCWSAIMLLFIALAYLHRLLWNHRMVGSLWPSGPRGHPEDYVQYRVNIATALVLLRILMWLDLIQGCTYTVPIVYVVVAIVVRVVEHIAPLVNQDTR